MGRTSDGVHLAYHKRNRQHGRRPGQVTIRVRYWRLATSWFDLLWMSLPELGQLAGQAGWQIAEAAPGPIYSAVLTRI